MSFLSDDEIICLIIEYINEDIYNYAILLDGEWGSGKTNFVKTKLIPSIEKLPHEIENQKRKSLLYKNVCNKRNSKEKRKLTKSVIYISLYGLKDTEAISSMLFFKILEFSLRINAKILPIIGAGTKAIIDKYGLSALSDIKPANIFAEFANYKRYIFIFDDLERCSIPINEVLGFINNLVEQNNIKVIIITNQSEIGIINTQNNLELKYLLSLHERIDFRSLEQKSKDSLNQNITTNNIYNLDQIKQRVSYLFEENELYNQIKEKLIGRTIYYKPQLKEIVPLIIDKCIKSERTNRIIKSIQNQIESIMLSKNHYNIRTLQFSLIYLAKICKSLDEQKQSFQEYEQIICEIFIAILKVSIAFKKGIKNYEWSENSEYGEICFNDEIWGMQSFKFIHDYIYSSLYDETRVIKVLSSYNTDVIAKNFAHDDPINLLSNYWELDDDFIVEQLLKMKSKLIEDKYATVKYKKILSLLFCLKGLDINPVDINEIFEIMKTNLMQSGGEVETYEEPLINANNLCLTEFKAFMDNLRKIQKESSQKKNEIDINAILNKEKWGNDIYNYYEDHKSYFLSKKSFLSYINIDALSNNLEISTTLNFSDFRRGLGSIYCYANISEVFSNDYDTLIKLNNYLNRAVYPKKIKEYNRKMFIDFLSKTIQQWKPEIKE
jgi:hypothetical protein